MELVRLVDRERGRTLDTHVYLPPCSRSEPAPLVVFGHGFTGHPRKFTRLLGAWCAAGYAVAAPTFPGTADTAAGGPTFDDLPRQPADLSFVLDELLERHGDSIDTRRIAFAGFSLGAVTTLGAAFEPSRRDDRCRAAIAISGGLGVFDGPFALRGFPLLVVHATDDPIVPYELGLDAYRRADPPKALVTLRCAYHHEPVEDVPATPLDALVRDATTAFLDLVLGGVDDAAARLRASVRGPVASLELDGL